MNITRDIITDLLPLYLAGEASPDTRALLEDCLREHPDFARTIREAGERGAALLQTVSAAPGADHEKATLERVRRFNRRRTNTLALAIAFGLMMFAFNFEGNRVTWFMLRDSPWKALFFLISSCGCSLAYVRMGRRLRM